MTARTLIVLSLVLTSSFASADERPHTQALLDQLTADLLAPAPAEVVEAPTPVAAEAEVVIAPVQPATVPAPAPESIDLNKSKKETQARSKLKTKKKTALKDGSKTASTPTLGYMMVGLLLIGLGGVAFWLKRRAAVGNPWAGAADIEQIATHRLTGKHSINLVKVGGSILVLGITDKSVSLLTELDPSSLGSQPSQAADDLAPGLDEELAGSFAERIARMRDTFKARPTGQDPFQAALADTAPADELIRLDERAAIRERIARLRRNVA